jgi:Arc/MetJ-type ribon-helix-helix transcriptional regulator
MTFVRQELPTTAPGKTRRSSQGTKSRRTGARSSSTKEAADTSDDSTTRKSESKKRSEPRPTRRRGQDGPSITKVAQVRLQPDEIAALEDVVRRLNLGSTSEALREGLRLLVREAAEVQAAEEIRAFYEGEQVPLPDGVAPATEAELQAADDAQW